VGGAELQALAPQSESAASTPPTIMGALLRAAPDRDR
jgi:hypothetical protein